MNSHAKYDVVIVGSGPNGLAEAIELAGAKLSTLVVEAKSTPGGGTRTEALTLPGFAHDVCSAVHPLAIASPFFKSLGLERYGLNWIQPPAPLAHVLDDDNVITLERSLQATTAQLGRDAKAYRQLFEPLWLLVRPQCPEARLPRRRRWLGLTLSRAPRQTRN